MNELNISEEELLKSEKRYLTKILRREATPKELLEFRSTLFTLGKSLFQIHSLKERGSNES